MAAAGLSLAAVAVCAAGLLGGSLSRGAPVLIQSQESRTAEGQPLFNRIRWIPGWKQDIWMMQQSHQGMNAGFGEWDRLAIVVDKSRFPRVARFYQLEPGALEWTVGARETPFRASCLMCHSNGPRAVRPEPGSAAAPLGRGDRVSVALWNLRIKTYGRVVADEAASARFAGTTLLAPRGPGADEKLAAESCARCHRETVWGRGPLRRQNSIAIRFMVEEGHMPPPGFALPENERRKLLRFTRGL